MFASASPSISSSYDGTVKLITGKYSRSNFGAWSSPTFDSFEGFVVVVARRTSWVTSEREEGCWRLEANLSLDLCEDWDWDFDTCFVNG